MQDEWKRQGGVTMQGSGTSAAKEKKEKIEQENRKQRELMGFLKQSLDNARQILAEMKTTIADALSSTKGRLLGLQAQLYYRNTLQQAKNTLDQGGTLLWEEDEDGNPQLCDHNLRKLVDKWKDKNPNSTLNTHDDAFVLALINQELPTLPSQNDLIAAIESQKLVVNKLNDLEQDRQGLEARDQNIDNAPDDEKKAFVKDVNQKDAEVQKIVAESDRLYAQFENDDITGEELKAKTQELVDNTSLKTAGRADNLGSENTTLGATIDEKTFDKKEEHVAKANDSYNDFSF